MHVCSSLFFIRRGKSLPPGGGLPKANRMRVIPALQGRNAEDSVPYRIRLAKTPHDWYNI